MPEITSIPFDHKIVSLSVERYATRSPGIHLSTIIRDRLITAGIVRQHNKPVSEGEQHLTFEQGFLWERAIQEYLETDEWRAREWEWFIANNLAPLVEDRIDTSEGHIVRPGECCMDGIYMTPDAANLKLWFVEEWKATSIRCKGFDIRQRKPEWLWQVAAYCRYYKMTRAVIRIWHYGEYPPQVSQFVIQFTPEEVESNWFQLLDHYKFMLNRGGQGIESHI